MEDRDEARRLMELQKDALKLEHGVDIESSKNRIPKNARSANNAKLAKLYEDAGEYEEELALFEKELDIITAHSLQELPDALNHAFEKEAGSYEQELKNILEAGWKNLVEVEKTHPQEQLILIQEHSFVEAIERLKGEYEGDFETQIEQILVKRWRFLIEMKEEHIKDERAEMKLKGMKPDHIRKVYRNYHGLLD